MPPRTPTTPRQQIPTTTTVPRQPANTTGGRTGASPNAGGAGQPTAAAGDVVGMIADLLGVSPQEAAAILTGGGAAGEQFAVFTSTYADPTAAVFARQFQPADRNYGPPGSMGPYVPGTEPVTVFGVDVPRLEETGTETTVGNLLQDFYTWDEDKIGDVQRLLYAAGFYGNVDIADIQWGIGDEQTFVAWAQAVTRTARYFQAGREVTVDDVLREAAAQRLGGLGGGAGATGAGGANVVVSLSDPLALYDTLDATAQSVLGRKATPEEQRMFVGIVHSLQRESQTAGQSAAQRAAQRVSNPGVLDADHSGDLSREEIEAALAQDGGVDAGSYTEVTQPSPDAQAEALLRREHPTEAGAHDIVGQFANFVQLLRGVV